MKTKTISLSIFSILIISLLTNASANPENFGYNKFFTNTKFHTTINSLPQNHEIALEEKMGVSTNDMSDHKHDDRTTTTSTSYKSIHLSENVSVYASNFSPKTIATLKENSER